MLRLLPHRSPQRTSVPARGNRNESIVAERIGTGDVSLPALLTELDAVLNDQDLWLLQDTYDAQADPERLQSITAGLLALAGIRQRLHRLMDGDLTVQQVSDELEDLGCEVDMAIQQVWGNSLSSSTRATLHRVASYLQEANAQLAPHLDGHVAPHRHDAAIPEIVLQTEPPITTTSVPLVATPTVIFPSDLAYQLYHELRPAERMAVIAGREGPDGVVTLGAAFDVTGDATWVHVRSDAHKLGNALMAMEHSGTFLAAWIHSHPGAGAEATYPSHIDTAQHADWIQFYSPHLVSGILVDGGWLRLWGTALEEGTVQVQFTGNGIAEEETHVYRLDQ